MFGLNIDPNNPRGNPAPAELRDLGVQTVRFTFYDSSGGNQIDPQKAQFHAERARAYHEVGISSLVILTYDTYPNRPAPDAGNPEWDQYIEQFARRSAQIAELLAPWTPSFQVWNEPDHPVHPNYVPTLREDVFGRMLRRTYDSIKAVNARFVVATAGLSAGDPSWLTRVIRSLGGSLPADVVAFHPYGQRPDRNWPHPNWAFGYVGDLLNGYYRAGQRKPIWITEMGIKEEDVGHNRQQAAEFLRRYYQTMTTRYNDKVQMMHWFCYSDGMVPPFGLVDINGNHKPAYDTFRQSATTQPALPVVAGGATVVPAPAPPAGATPPPLPPATTPSTPTSPVVVPAPPPPVPSTPTTPPTSSTTLTQLTGRMAALQATVAQLQQQVQQLNAQQIQLQGQIQQLQGQPSTPVISAPPATGPVRPLIQDISQQLARHATKRFPTRALSRIERLIVHHTAIQASVGAERIAQHRVNRQDWAGIGYHYFITGPGVIQETNALTVQSTHAGRFDSIAIGICFAGDFTNVPPAPGQIEAGAQLIAWLLTRFGLALEALVGYKELVNTQSPGIQWDNGARWGDQLRAQVRTKL